MFKRKSNKPKMTDKETNPHEDIQLTQDHSDTGNEEIHEPAANNTSQLGAESTKKEAEKNDETGKLAEEWKMKYLYLSAEFENYKKRTLRDRMDFMQMANADLITTLLPVLDDFERSVKAFEKVQNNAAIEGVVLIQHKLKSVLEHKGLKAINSLGKPFDADQHEAIANVPVEDESKKGTVIDELEKGYLLNEKIIRHAKVAVGA